MSREEGRGKREEGPAPPAPLGTLEGRRIGVLGLARSGLAAARLALARGASVYASDLGDSPATRAAADEVRALGGEAEAGRHDVTRLAGCDAIVLSPGIPPSAGVLREPALRPVPVVPEIDFAFGELRGHVIGVTGTNGKTTVTGLAEAMLQRSGVDAVAAGNIGTALSEVALRDPQPEVVVVEVSSFQLGMARAFAPSVGVLTNLAPDHLDWYPSVEAYYADKARLFQNAGVASRWVLNGDDAPAAALPGDAPGERFFFRVATPPVAGERGAFLQDDGRLMMRLGDAEPTPLLRADELPLLGPHNVANALAAALAATLAGADPDSIGLALRESAAPPHRLEPLGERDGVLWINDSKSTNVTSTEVALRSMTRPTVLLLGGRHKGEPYSSLVPLLRDRVRCVVAFGEAAARIEADLGAEVAVELVAGGFDAAVARAAGAARPGDAVLLSPACSSYDMFADYEARGARFAELAAGAGR